jgi:hypothetical protein
MRFADLRYFAKTSAGGLSAEGARALKLPMPEDVLEQFIIDHALNHKFQREYADLDLYAISWELAQLPTAEIISSWSKCDGYVDEVAEILSNSSAARPLPHMTPESSNAWIDSGTWRRSPVFLDSVLSARSGLHLAEGHTRVGALKGLLDTDIPVRASHSCWVGRLSTEPLRSFDWVSVLEEHPLSFHSWVFDAIGDNCLRGQVADRLVDLEHTLRYERSFPPTFDGLVELTAADQGDENSRVSREQLVQLTQEWRDELERLAGRRLRLSP